MMANYAVITCWTNMHITLIDTFDTYGRLFGTLNQPTEMFNSDIPGFHLQIEISVMLKVNISWSIGRILQCNHVWFVTNISGYG